MLNNKTDKHKNIQLQKILKISTEVEKSIKIIGVVSLLLEYLIW